MRTAASRDVAGSSTGSPRAIPDSFPPQTTYTCLALPLTRDLFASPTPLLPYIREAFTKSTLHRFDVVFTSFETDDGNAITYETLRRYPAWYFDDFQRFLTCVYSTLASAQWTSGRIDTDVNVLFSSSLQAIERLGQHYIEAEKQLILVKVMPIDPNSPNPASIPSWANVTVVDHPLSSSDTSTLARDPVPSDDEQRDYPVVALGGTFDHLHPGHKVLLQSAAFLTRRKLIVGVMDDSKLKTKSNADLIQSTEARIKAVKDFLRSIGVPPIDEESNVEGHARADVLVITDPFGPTITDEDIQALVVSHETTSGGAAVTVERQKRGLRLLDIFTIDVIGGGDSTSSQAATHSGIFDLAGVKDESQLKKLKMGSSGIREYLKAQASIPNLST